jgi:hypothetical protein
MENLKNCITLFSSKEVISLMRYGTDSLFGAEFKCCWISMIKFRRFIGHFQLNLSHFKLQLRFGNCRVVFWKKSS